jgi:serine phosphatase RsbU (regulator of sigma subunit)/pSer/pThr/pTyr-binding forkhead associated (FHA) protein
VSQGPPVLQITFDRGVRVFELTEPIVTIGRSVDNVLEIPDPNMSRRHCVVEQRENGEVFITDCNSSNGTRVNEDPVISQPLNTGDEIVCGSTLIRFADSREALAALPQPSDLKSLLESSANDEATINQRKAKPPRQSQMAVLTHELTHERDDLRKLLEITRRLNQVHDLRRLLETIIDAAIELMAAERGFLILLSDADMKIEIARNIDGTSINDPSMVVSTQICRQVIDGGQPVLTTNAAADSRFGRYKSVVGLKLRSILCVPFRIRDETFGTVYLDAGDVGAFSERDVELLGAFSDQAAIAIENARLLHAARRRERIEQELRIASQIQRKLLPHKTPDFAGIDVYGWMHSAKEVGGDYYDFIKSPDGKSLFICIGDVSGKGVPAGMVMASARSALRPLIERGVHSTREMVVSLNRLLCEDLDQEMFLSFVLMRFEQGSGTVHYTGAGHENILFWRTGQQKIEAMKTGGMVLGITTRLEEAIEEKTFELAPGDGVVLYTDGVTETVDAENQQYQLERLIPACERHLNEPPKQALHGILSEVLRFKGRQQQRDDITMLVVKRQGEEAPPPPPLAAQGEPTRPR